MSIKSKLAGLEKRMQVGDLERHCPYCVGIDRSTGSGIFYNGVVLSDHDRSGRGIAWCMCKGCHCRFTCRIDFNNQHGGSPVTEARFKPPYNRAHRVEIDDDPL